MQVCLVNMPMVALERPSLALGILKAAAAERGLEVTCLHPGFDFANRVGLETYCLLLDTAPDQNIGDWVFAGAAFPEARAQHEAFVEDLDAAQVAAWLRVERDALAETLWGLRAEAERLVRDTARTIVEAGARIVGCSSVFQQQGASLALLRAVKDLDPTIWTMLGGANCEGPMGVAVHDAFDWVDVVVSGEADLLFADLCRTLLSSSREEVAQLDLPDGVIGPRRRRALRVADGAAPRARVDTLDRCPVPDFAEYFEALERSGLQARIYAGLPVETSRGCWWGQTHHCTFCGLNGGSMSYRSKSPGRVLEELATLTARYGVRRVHVVDNILDRGHLKTVVPALAEAGAPYSMFYETKANLTEAELRRLADAGVTRIQPGLESLHLGALKLMDKGTTPVQNLQLLRRARHLGMFVTWNFLWLLPGDEVDWYEAVEAWLPSVMHLQAPNTLVPVRFDRFSPYHQRPEAYGLELRPTRGLKHLYPVDEATLAELAYYFDDHARPLAKLLRQAAPGARRFSARMQAWMAAWARVRCAHPDSPPPPRLEMIVDGDAIDVLDTRPDAEVERRRLEGLDAWALDACDRAPTRAALARARAEAGAGATPEALDAAIERLKAARLVLELDGRLLALPTAPPRADYIPVSEYPAGYVLRDGAGARLRAAPATPILSTIARGREEESA